MIKDLKYLLKIKKIINNYPNKPNNYLKITFHKKIMS